MEKINVRIAALGGAVFPVELDEGSKVLDVVDNAVKSNGDKAFDRNAITKLKRNGDEISMSDSVNDGDLILVINEPVKGGNVVTITSEVVYEEQSTADEGIAVEASSNYDVACYVAKQKGINLNCVKGVVVDGETKELTDPATDGHYEVIVTKCCGDKSCC